MGGSCLVATHTHCFVPLQAELLHLLIRIDDQQLHADRNKAMLTRLLLLAARRRPAVLTFLSAPATRVDRLWKLLVYVQDTDAAMVSYNDVSPGCGIGVRN